MFKKLVGLLTVAVAGLLFSGVASAQAITGSAHDFSGDGYTGLNGEICIVCHTPHNADGTVSGAPLWNHAVTAATFTLYGSPTFNAPDITQPDGASKLCLSCHDGTVAIDSFGGTTGTDIMTGSALVGTDLSDDHPISFTYTLYGGLADPTSASGVAGGTTIDADMLFAGKVECASCHNVHDNTLPPFLIKSNATSGLCLTCHTK